MPDLPPDNLTAPIRLAVIGAGIFARDAHLPALLRQSERFRIVAIYSRTYTSAARLAGDLPHAVDLYTDLDALLANPEVEAVDIVLPIPVQADIIDKALRAGKHVISEKPIAADIATGRQLLQLYGDRPRQVWMVGENWRYETAFRQAAELVRSSAIGRPITCQWTIHTPMTPANKYYHTAWRRSSSLPGGLLLDGGVHYVAVLRTVVGEIVAVTAVMRQRSPDLPLADTLSATLAFDNGAIGSFLMSFAGSESMPGHLTVVGERGILRVTRGQLEVDVGGDLRALACPKHDGVDIELAAFAEAIRAGQPHRNTPHEGLQDLAVIEAMLEAARTGQMVEPERVIPLA